LYAFDGTSNDRDRDRPNSKDAPNELTNVAILWDLYKKEKFYTSGVGTRDSRWSNLWLKNLFGLAGGAGGEGRIEDMLGKLDAQVKKRDCKVDVIGFSRGAAMAREFANRVSDKYPKIHIRWLGLFDTVASFGLGGNDINPGYRLRIPDNVDALLHLTASSETRRLFPLSSICPISGEPPRNPNWKEQFMFGAHSDIGGGYPDHRALANISLRMMHADGLAHGVPFKAIPSEYQYRRDYNYETRQWGWQEHDSRWANDKVLDFVRTMTLQPPPPRTIYYYP
jgi:hypothetical protein